MAFLNEIGRGDISLLLRKNWLGKSMAILLTNTHSCHINNACLVVLSVWRVNLASTVYYWLGKAFKRSLHALDFRMLVAYGEYKRHRGLDLHGLTYR